ncbi:guanylate binding protein 1 [Triplophysa rosa]|uniref:Guanylate binding protein 1 n=1 Tax=Triplophysa rosa TaxID=992332 RepID=A0A9W7WW96_TRIRA|nr:guanylate binding protein 1 [Triplophysa rosa]
MASGGHMPAPVCLIENGHDGKLCVTKDAIDILNGINEPVVVVSIVGLYRTGKSYLMNRLAGQQSGFALGNTVESKTKGVWMWCVPHPSVKGQTLMLLDTEGLGDVQKGDSKNDGWIFCLAVLLSSTLVYNSRGTIDNDAVQKLQYITELAEQIKIRSPSSPSEDEEEEENSQFVCFFPSFVWAVRDFTLDLKINGRKATEDEYLQYALELKKGLSKKNTDYNLPRECIRRYFPSRKCFVFLPPASPENMRRLESLRLEDLVADFREATHRFCEYIFLKSPVKTLKGGHRVTGKCDAGSVGSDLCRDHQQGKVPCLDNAVVALANLENKAAVQEAFKVYQSGMEEFPVSMENITSVHQKSSSLATSEFMTRSFKDEKGEYVTNLKQDIDMYYVVLMEENEMASERKCKELLKDLFSDMNERLQNGEYSQCGGYEIYCRDRDAIIAQYRREPNKGVKAEAVLNEFLNERAAEANSILHADKKLTESEREIKERKEMEDLLQQKCKEEEEKRIESERMMKVEQERQKDTVKQMEEKFNKEMEQRREEMDRAMESKLKEQEELLSKGFKEKADELHEEIKSFKEKKEAISVGGIFKDYVMPLLGTGADLLSNIFMHRSLLKGLKALK